MVHFTCDLCGKDLPAEGDPRYVIKIEVFADFDPNEITQDDLDDDQMEAVSELLQRYGSPDAHELDAQIRKSFRFDLCSCCHEKYLKDPLGKDQLRLFDFSQN